MGNVFTKKEWSAHFNRRTATVSMQSVLPLVKSSNKYKEMGLMKYVD